MSLAVENILGIIDRDGEEELALDLSSFSCGVNDEIQTFLTDKAIEFARKKMSITYLVSDDEDGELLGYFTLAHKVLEVPAAGLSNNVKRRMSRYARLDESKDSYMVSAFLLAQLMSEYRPVFFCCPKTIGQRGDLLGHCDHRRDGKGQLLLPDSHCRASSADRHAEEAVISA